MHKSTFSQLRIKYEVFSSLRSQEGQHRTQKHKEGNEELVSYLSQEVITIQR